MAVYQSWNPRIKAWIKFKQNKGERPKIVNTKQRNSEIPFSGVKIRGR